MTAAQHEPAAELAGIVVHWHNEEQLGRLLAAWPQEPRFELIVVDNGSSSLLPAGTYRLLRPGRNLGFAGGANAGAQVASAPLLLILNPDARPRPGALVKLVEGFREHPEAAGLAPRLVGEDGDSQHAWQLGRLPSLGRLLLAAFGWGGPPARGSEPPAGVRVEQPAAAALALRRAAFDAVGGFDEGFFPAWFEDVDLARRLADRGLTVLYHPAAELVHEQGATVPRLGYGRFLWLYSRNLVRYLEGHWGRGWAWSARALMVPGALLRLALLPLRRPRRATDRRQAWTGLWWLLAGALSGFRQPRFLAAEVAEGSAPANGPGGGKDG